MMIDMKKLRIARVGRIWEREWRVKEKGMVEAIKNKGNDTSRSSPYRSGANRGLTRFGRATLEIFCIPGKQAALPRY